MSKPNKKDYEKDDGGHDGRGRYRKGVSGNPRGRPPKPPGEPWSLQESMIRALDQVVPVAAADGTMQRLPVREVLVMSAVRSATKASPKDQIAILERMAKLDVMKEPPAEELDNDEWLSEEDRRLIEIAGRAWEQDLCCRCDMPIRKKNNAKD